MLTVGLLVRGLSKLMAVGVVPAALGIGLGIGASAVTNIDGEPAPAPSASNVRVQVVSAVLHPAGTPRNRRRQRARLSVHVRVTNGGKAPIADVNPMLISPARIRPDPAARDAAGSLLKPVAPGESAKGRLRLETAGAVTKQLASTRRARLRIARQTVEVRLKLGRPISGTAARRKR